MTFQEIARFIRRTYPAATSVAFEITHDQMVMRVTHNEPTELSIVTSLDGTEHMAHEENNV